ncbi:conserved hypothetical protein [Coccidioides posadasii str. Silveira]|uniref:Uncharacterized protein n=1 Tax=Coccidioides posadasii (strain RMSCC 757 / Silveira) TaxID=443226 RepID=E9D9T5_COCPS|nr:conserved hypothetical protein [Coccidioides posadasii str. Silveira]
MPTSTPLPSSRPIYTVSIRPRACLTNVGHILTLVGENRKNPSSPRLQAMPRLVLIPTSLHGGSCVLLATQPTIPCALRNKSEMLVR